MGDMVWNLVAVVLAVLTVRELVQAVRGPVHTPSPLTSATKAMLLLCLAMVLHLGDRQSLGQLFTRYAIITGLLGPLLVNYLRCKLSQRAARPPLPGRTPKDAAPPR
jgi:hypothetical protein